MRLADLDPGLEPTRTDGWPAECPRCGDRPHGPSQCTTSTPKEAMPIARDLSDLPPADNRDGLTPDPSPRFISVLADRWAEDSDDDKATALGTRFRHSDAGKCSRAIAYTAAGIPKSDPMDITGVWNTSLGTLIHEQWQEALTARFPDAEVEVKCATVGADGSGHIDAVIRTYVDGESEFGPPLCTIAYELPLCTIAYELKTMGGFGFKAAVGAQRKGTPAEGPRTSHMLQAALNGAAVDADEVVIGYLAKECISLNVAKRFGISDDVGRFAAEWTLTREQYEPLARLEAERVDSILALVDDGLLAARKTPEVPAGAEISDPATGEWVRTADGEAVEVGSTWECGYCAHQSLCIETSAGRAPVADATAVAVKLGLAPKEAA